MPKEGLWRAGRWADVVRFPPPPRPVHVLPTGNPVLEGYRWEDAFGQFSTAKLSVSAEAAIGRTLARYRRREISGLSILDTIKGFLTNAPDNPAEPDLIDNTIPISYFEDAHRLYMEYDDNFRFIDIEHDRTQDTLRRLLADPLEGMGGSIGPDLSQHRDRRLTRLVTTTLHEIRGEMSLDHVAGLRYKAPEKHWDAYVLWDSPMGIDLSKAESVTPIFPYDADLQAAAKTLGIRVPDL
jgi:hypothetical protein